MLYTSVCVKLCVKSNSFFILSLISAGASRCTIYIYIYLQRYFLAGKHKQLMLPTFRAKSEDETMSSDYDECIYATQSVHKQCTKNSI